MGVSALAESSIKCILHQWPDAQISLLGSGHTKHHLKLMGRDICLRTLPISFCKNIFVSNHFTRLFVLAVIFKIIRWKKFKRFFSERAEIIKNILELDLVADITGGDSFSDIYGLRRFLLGTLVKWFFIIYGKKLVMLPQTYGPFGKKFTKMLAKYTLKHSDTIYSRDREGVNYVRRLLKSDNQDGGIRFLPDLAFVLDSDKPEQINVGSLPDVKAEDSVVVGINVSGLLYNGGYTGGNMFGLKENYSRLISEIIEMFLGNDKVMVLLVPHVFPPKGYEIESDPIACSKIYSSLRGKYENRIFFAQGNYNQNQIKYIIGMCDFFLGSRMHACIAALSQNIPAIGLAYSQKFKGVFDSIDLSQCVIDMSRLDKNEILSQIDTIFADREKISSHLRSAMPGIKKNIINVFHDIGKITNADNS